MRLTSTINRSNISDRTKVLAAREGGVVHFVFPVNTTVFDKHEGHLPVQQREQMKTLSHHHAALEVEHFPSEKKWKQWLNSSDGTTIAEGEYHPGGFLFDLLVSSSLFGICWCS